MTNKSLTKYENKCTEYLDEKSTLELVDMVMYMDSLNPYVKLFQNGDMKNFLEKKYTNIPIHNAEEFNLFYEFLTEQIEIYNSLIEQIENSTEYKIIRRMLEIK